MKQCCISGRSAVAPLIAIGLAMRMFWGMAVDAPYALNAAWLCPLLGFLLCLPLLLALKQLDSSGNGSIWDVLSQRISESALRAFALLFAILLLLDAAQMMRVTASSIAFIALYDVPLYLLILPLGLVALVIALVGGDAAGHSARIWLRMLPWLAALVLVLQFRNYNLGWIAPLLGSGMEGILSGGVYCAGCIALMALLWSTAVPDGNKHGVILYVSLSTIAAMLLLISQQMRNPVMLGSALSHAGRIDLILSNGRISISPELLLDILWYGSLLHLLSAEICGANAFIHWAFPRARPWISAAGEAIFAAGLAMLGGRIFRLSPTATSLLFPLICGAFALLLLMILLEKRRTKPCGETK